TGDYRLYNRFQLAIPGAGATSFPPIVTESAAFVGLTKDPCNLIPDVDLVLGGEAHSSNGINGVTSNGDHAFQMNEGRIGALGQAANRTINGHSTPWIWSVIEFDANGNLVMPVDHQIFPTYYV